MDTNDFIVGLKDETFQINGNVFKSAKSPVIYIPEALRFLGVDWWPKRYLFDAIQGDVEETHTVEGVEVSLPMEVCSPITVEPAAWWRRLGYAVLRHIPGVG